MKKIHYIVATFALLSLGSCKKFLDKQPESNNTVDVFYKEPNHGIAATNATYDILKWDGAYNRAMWVTDMMTGDSKGADQAPIAEIINQRTTTSNTFVYNVWKAYYTGISRANIAIEKIPTIPFPETAEGTALKNRLIGENRFLRALYHFNLVRHFGDVPLITSYVGDASANFSIPRTPVAAVLDQVIEDLKFAEGALPATYGDADQGRATKGAAQGLLTRAYIQAQKWADASAKANDIISGGQYSLYDDYKTNFYGENLARPDNGANKESIFEVQFRSGGGGWAESAAGYWGNEYFGPGGCGCNTWVGFNWNLPVKQHGDAYEPGDERKFVNIFSEGDTIPRFAPKTFKASWNGQAPHNIKKWFVGRAETQGLDAPTNIPVIRYADVLLMKAEADANLGNFATASDNLNLVRRRAGLKDTTLTAANFVDVIIHERRVELAFENVYWFDLVRTGKAAQNYKETTGNDLPTFRYLWPIPATERDLNPNLTQNPGY